MEPLKKNLIVAAVLGSETPDTVGETLNVKNCDISSLKGGPVNTEHISPSDLQKENDPNFQGFTTIVGKVKECKKIFSEKDCDNEYELKAWNELEVPIIFGYVELFDDAHDNAKAATALARKHPELLGFSVEGQILKRKGNELAETVVTRMALTMKPANRSSRIQGVVQDSKSQNQDAIFKAESDDQTVLRKTSSFKQTYIVQEDFGLSNAMFKLRKALDAGMPASAPSALTGGAALQKESHLAKLEKLTGKKPLSRDLLKKLLADANDDQLEKVYSHLKRLRLKKYEEDAAAAFEQLKK